MSNKNLYDDNIKIYSEEVRDILSEPPKSILRWGNTLLFGFISVLMITSFIIKYPDLVVTQITITTQIPPEKVIAKNTGRIECILVKNNESVKSGTPLAIIENTASYDDVFLLKKIIDSTKFSNKKFNFPIEIISNLNLGMVEEAYASFEREYLTYLHYQKLTPHKIDIIAQKTEMYERHKRLSILKNQKEIGQKELIFKKQELSRYQKLFDKGIISSQEWEQKNLEYLQQERNFHSLTSQISEVESSINELNKNKKTTLINQSKDDVNLTRNLILSFNQLKKSISEWEMAYVLTASISGNVSFMKFWIENQQINEGENIFVVTPDSESEYIGKIKAETLNAGKIKKGQTVNIRLNNYPDKEFGIIKGEVKSISPIPDQDGFLLIDVSLPNKLDTSYNKKISLQQEMSGTADIVTDDLRLIDRILYQFREIFSRKKYN